MPERERRQALDDIQSEPWVFNCVANRASRSDNQQTCKGGSIDWTPALEGNPPIMTCQSFGRISHQVFGDCSGGRIEPGLLPGYANWVCTKEISSEASTCRYANKFACSGNRLEMVACYTDDPGLTIERPISTVCFSSETLATLVTGSDTRQVPISSLQVGDIVVDGNGNPTEFWGHLHSGNESASMLQFWHGPEVVLTVSPEHLINVNNEYKYASDVTVGDFLSGTRVDQIKTVTEHGYHAPLTASGTILVGKNGIAASSFAVIHQGLQNFAPWYMGLRRWLHGADFLSSGAYQPNHDLWLWVLRKIGLARN